MVQKVFIPVLSFWFSIYNLCYGYTGDTNVLCADGLGSVKTLSLCDYVANCQDASDELNFNLCKMLSKYTCPQKNQVKCDSRNRFGGHDSYWSNRCTDIITACNVGPKCFAASSEALCNEVQNGRLLSPKFTEQPSKLEKTEEEEEFYEMMKFIGEAMNETMKRNFSECPPFFTPFGDTHKCISLFTPIKVSWFEARMFCESMTGNLAILDDINTYIQVLKYIEEKEIKSRFWVGARYALSKSGNSTESKITWAWLNGKPVKMGVPFWSLYTVGIPEKNKQCEDNERKLMPRFTGDAETCLSILEENFYYFSDEWCTIKLSPLCMTNKI
ncbi:UNVERIFIED_CONTAM: hypothetical protein RMT77_017062 [Armadillidium vulgare]